MIDFGSGSLYVKKSDGDWEGLGSINDAEITTSCYADSESYMSLTALNETSVEFTGVGKISKEAVMVLTGFKELILKCCPNKKVVHLALNGRTKRIRKKNFNRAIKILEEN